jgi:hypothetical protein
MKMTNNSSRVR